jgi:predicted DNA-binding protein (UPF0278 family)
VRLLRVVYEGCWFLELLVKSKLGIVSPIQAMEAMIKIVCSLHLGTQCYEQSTISQVDSPSTHTADSESLRTVC